MWKPAMPPPIFKPAKPGAAPWYKSDAAIAVGVVAVAMIVIFGMDEEGMPLLFLLGAWGLSGLIGMALAERRGRGIAGLLLGLFLGPIGWVIAALLPADPDVAARAYARALAQSGQGAPPQATRDTSERACPWCAEAIKSAAIVCRFCGRDVEPLVSSAGPDALGKD
jgi:hypothetical protein